MCAVARQVGRKCCMEQISMSFAKHRSKCNSIGSDYAMQSPAHLCYSAPFKLLVHNFAKRLVSILNLCVGPPGTTYHTQVRRSVPCNPHVLQHLSLRFHLFFICVHTTHAGQTQCALQNPHVLQHLSLRFHLFFYLCSYDARRSDAACPCNLHVQWQLLQCPTAAAFYM